MRRLIPSPAALAVLAAALVALPALAQAPDPEARLVELGITLPEQIVSAPNRPYELAVQSGNIVYLAGHVPCGDWGASGRGKVPTEVTLDEARAAARQVAICLMGTLKAHLGDLNRVSRILRLHGMVNAAPEFTQHSQVMNAASELLIDVFGDRGRHARSAVGMSSLPVNFTVEIEMTVEVTDAADAAASEVTVDAAASGPQVSAAASGRDGDGRFTLAQAEVGLAVFRESCAECHAAGELSGEEFLFEWGESSVGRLFRRVSRTMPDDAPGSLDAEQYAAVIAYILQLNGHPAGSSPLPADDGVLDAWRIGR